MSHDILIESSIELNKSLNSLKYILSFIPDDDPIYDFLLDFYKTLDFRFESHQQQLITFCRQANELRSLTAESEQGK